jgi:hypothetical protein
MLAAEMKAGTALIADVFPELTASVPVVGVAWDCS